MRVAGELQGQLQKLPPNAAKSLSRLTYRAKSAGATVELRITKRGDDYLRTLLIQGAKSAVMTAHKRSDRISQWLVQLKERVGWHKAVVALANKNARILWAVLTRDATFDPNHVPEAPAPHCALSQRPAL